MEVQAWLTTSDASFAVTVERRRWRALRALLTAAVLVALYYLLPLDSSGSDTSVIVKLALGASLFVGLMLWQLRAIAQSDNPGLRGARRALPRDPALPAIGEEAKRLLALDEKPECAIVTTRRGLPQSAELRRGHRPWPLRNRRGTVVTQNA